MEDRGKRSRRERTREAWRVRKRNLDRERELVESEREMICKFVDS